MNVDCEDEKDNSEDGQRGTASYLRCILLEKYSLTDLTSYLPEGVKQISKQH